MDAGEAVVDGDGAHELDGATTSAAADDLGVAEAAGLDTMTAPIRQVRVANFSPACCWAGAAGADDEAGATAAAACLVTVTGEALASALVEGAGSRVDTSAAPTRQVRMTNLSSAELRRAVAGNWEDACTWDDGGE